jgi:hypothetical protein
MFYNMYRVKPVAVFGPSQLCHAKNLKLGLDREPPKSNLSKGSCGFLLPPGECVVREGGNTPSRARVCAVSGCVACGRARFDAVDKKEMM